jgi:hypothetical protein
MCIYNKGRLSPRRASGKETAFSTKTSGGEDGGCCCHCTAHNLYIPAAPPLKGRQKKKPGGMGMGMANMTHDSRRTSAIRAASLQTHKTFFYSLNCSAFCRVFALRAFLRVFSGKEIKKKKWHQSNWAGSGRGREAHVHVRILQKRKWCMNWGGGGGGF